jgi:hypothetical protein
MPCYRRHDRDDLERRVGKPAPACHYRQIFIGCHHRREAFAKPSIIPGVPQRRHRDADKDMTACHIAGRLAMSAMYILTTTGDVQLNRAVNNSSSYNPPAILSSSSHSGYSTTPGHHFALSNLSPPITPSCTPRQRKKQVKLEWTRPKCNLVAKYRQKK